MASQPGRYDDLIPQQAPAPATTTPAMPPMAGGNGVQYLDGPPRLPTPQTSAQAQGDALGNQRTAQQISLDRAKFEADQRQREYDRTHGALPQGYQINPATGTPEPMPNTPQAREAATQTQAPGAAVESLDSLLRNAHDALTISRQGWATGGSSWLGNIPGTRARDLRNIVGIIQANTALQELARLKASGTNLTPVSNSDIELMGRTLANLDTSSSQEQFERQLENVIGTLERSRAALSGQTYVPGLDNMTPAQRAAALAARGLSETEPNGAPNGPGGGGAPVVDVRHQRPTGGTPTTGAAESDYYNPQTGELVVNVQGPGLGDQMRNNRTGQTFTNTEQGWRNDQTGAIVSELPGSIENDRLVEGAYTQTRVGPDISDVRSDSGGLIQGIDTFGRNVGRIATLGLSDISAAQQDRLIHGDSAAEANTRESAIRSYDWQNSPKTVVAGQLIGGGLLPFPAARAEEGLSLLGRYGRQMGTGATYGGISGFNASDGSAGERVTNALLGAAAGAGVPVALGEIAPRVGSALSAPFRPSRRAVGEPNINALQAFQEEGIPVTRPFVDPSSRAQMATLETQPGGHQIVRDGIDATRTGIESRVSELGGQGSVRTSQEMGQMIRGSVERRVETSRQHAGRYYDRASQEAGNTTVMPSEMLGALDRNIAEVSRLPGNNSGLLSYLRRVRGDFVDQNGNPRRLSVGDVRNIRTAMNGEINRRGLGTSNAERIMMNVLDAGRSDVQRHLGVVSPRALRSYEQGDQMWRRMVDDRHQLLEGLTGDATNPIAGGDVYAKVQNMMRSPGNATNYRRILSTMEPAERASYTATLMDRVGRESNNSDFSPARFLQNTKDWSPEALTTTFGRDGARSIENLRVAAERFRQTERSLNNSRSGLVQNMAQAGKMLLNFRSTIGGAIGATGGTVVGGPVGATVAGVVGAGVGATLANRAQRLSAQALMNPDLGRWLGQAARAENPSQVRVLTTRLGAIAARNPAISHELQPLIQAISRAANDNAGMLSRSAASGNDPNQRQQDRR